MPPSPAEDKRISSSCLFTGVIESEPPDRYMREVVPRQTRQRLRRTFSGIFIFVALKGVTYWKALW